MSKKSNLANDKVLLRIRREYSKDEKFAILLEGLRNKNIEIGVLKSEKAELEHQLTLRNTESNRKLKDMNIALRKENANLINEAAYHHANFKCTKLNLKP